MEAKCRLRILCVFLTGTLWAAAQDSAPAEETAVGVEYKTGVSAVRTIKIVRPNIVVTASHLSRVEIWYYPTGTGVSEALLGAAKRATPAGSHERWIFPISNLPGYPHAFLAVSLEAKGYGAGSKPVGEKSLPVTGVSELNRALFGKLPD